MHLKFHNVIITVIDHRDDQTGWSIEFDADELCHRGRRMLKGSVVMSVDLVSSFARIRFAFISICASGQAKQIWDLGPGNS